MVDWHINGCIYRVVYCPLATCEVKYIFIMSYFHHLYHTHKEILRPVIGDDGEGEIFIPGCGPPQEGPTLVRTSLISKEHTYFLQTHFTSTRMYFWVIALAYQHEMVNKDYVVTMNGPEHHITRYSGKITPIDANPRKYRDHPCILIEALKTYIWDSSAQEYTKITYKLRLK